MLSGTWNPTKPTSDIGRLIRWRKQVPSHLTQLPPREQWPAGVPWEGLTGYWYPVLPANMVASPGRRIPTGVRLMGRDIALFHGADGRLRAIDAACPHRGALLTLGWTDVHSPGTLTCRYHGMTFDGDGNCVAALADGPQSAVPKVVRTRAYCVEVRHGVVWLFVGEPPVPRLEDTVPHLEQVMSGRWPTVRFWDWPVNYLSAVDNNSDILHPSFAHRTCARHRDMAEWDYPTYEYLPCGGIRLGIKGAGPGPTGPRCNTSFEMHLPGYNVFQPLRGEDYSGSIFWAVPIDTGNVRMMRMTSFGGSVSEAIRARILNTWMVSKWGPRDNIYYCNAGPDAALAMSQGPMGDRHTEHLCRMDRGMIKVRKQFEDAYHSQNSRDNFAGEVPNAEITGEGRNE